MVDNIRTPQHRGSFCHLVKPQIQKNDDGKETEKWAYSVLIPKGNKEGQAFLADLRVKMQDAIKEKFGKTIEEKHLKNFPIKDGDETDEDGDTRAEHAGHWVVRVSSFRKPSLINRKGEPIDNDEHAYSGAWYISTLRPRAWDNPKSGKGVSVTVLAIIKMRDDDQFGEGGINAADEYSDLVGTEDESPAAPASKPAAKAAPAKPAKAKPVADDPLAGL